jgi:hypothetical protein
VFVVFGVSSVSERLPPEGNLLSYLYDLRQALDGYRAQVQDLNQVFVRAFPYTRYYITFKTDKEGDRDYLYPIFRRHNDYSVKGAPRGDYVGPRLSRRKSSELGEGAWWRKHKSLIEVFNKWVRKLRTERSRLQGLARELWSLVRKSLVLKYPATHNAASLAGQEVQELKDRVCEELLALLPPIPQVGYEL